MMGGWVREKGTAERYHTQAHIYVSIRTGNVRPGIVITGAPPKYDENSAAFIVADINTTRNLGWCGNKSRNTISRKSESSLRSCTSSTITCETPARPLLFSEDDEDDEDGFE